MSPAAKVLIILASVGALTNPASGEKKEEKKK